MFKFIKTTLLCFIANGFANAQTAHTITYASSGLPTNSSICNVFNITPPYSVGGYEHWPVAGGATFDGTYINLKTQSGSSTSNNFGTAYAIKFPFKAGYIYTVSLNAKGTDGSGSNVNFPELLLSVFKVLPDPNTTNPTACGAVPETNWAVLQQNVVSHVYLNSSQQTYSSQSFTASTSSTPSFLTILAYRGSTSLNTAYIASVTITEATPDLVLSPTSLSTTCGTTATQTFTVSNPNNVQNITSYEWNLGSSSNGWLYNGSAAPQNISTTTNSITLTPICGSTLSNVAVTVKTNNTNYKTYNCNVAVRQPTLTINGASNICTNSENYTIDSLPCNATVTWSASPSGIVSLATSGNTATLTKITDGDFTLTATVNNVCGSNNIVLHKAVHTGLPIVLIDNNNITASSNPSAPDYNDVCTLQSTTLTMEVTGATGVTWSGPSHLVANWHTDGNNLVFYFYGNNQQAVFQITATNSCGSITKYYAFNSIDCSGGGDPCGGGLTTFNVSVSPNPSTNKIIVVPNVPPPCNELQLQATNNNKTQQQTTMSANNLKTTINPAVDKRVIKSIEIYNATGKLCKTLQYNNSQQAAVDVSNLATGMYVLKISNGEKTVQKKILVQH